MISLLIALATPLVPLTALDQQPLTGAGCMVRRGKDVLLMTDYRDAAIRTGDRVLHMKAMGIDEVPGTFDLDKRNIFEVDDIQIQIIPLAETKRSGEEETSTRIEMRLFRGRDIYPIKAMLICYA